MACSAHCYRLALLFFPAALLLLSACSSPGRNYTNGMDETLETEILTNGSKMFVYRLRWPEDAIPNHIRVARSSRTPEPYQQSGVVVNRHTYERLQQNVGYAVGQAGYCRTGYMELDGSVSRYHLWLKGECREDADADDIGRFGKQSVIKIK